MRSTYKWLAYTIDGLVLLQAAMIAWAIFGFGKYIDEGNSFNKSMLDSGEWHFTEERGFMVHGMNGTMLIPLVALALVIVSFFAHVPQGRKWAGLVFGAIVVQVALGIFGHGLPLLGLLHGLNAFVVLGLAFLAARAASAPEAIEPGRVAPPEYAAH